MYATRRTGLPVAIGFAGTLLLAGSCGGEEVAGVPPDAARLVGSQVDTLVRTLNSGVADRRREVIHSQEGWVQFWNQVHARRSPRPDPPVVDFGDAMVVAVSMGQRSTGGYQIEIEEVSRAERELYVVVREVSPGDSCVTTQALTAPVLVVRVPRVEGGVVFIERNSVQECS